MVSVEVDVEPHVLESWVRRGLIAREDDGTYTASQLGAHVVAGYLARRERECT